VNKKNDNAIFDVTQRMNWAGETHTRRRKYRRMISLAHHVTFFLGKRFPKSVPLIFVLGYPKSGTSWVCQITSDYLRLPFPQHAILPVGFPAVVHGHDMPTKKYPLGVYVVRDGRDVMVSAFNHLRNQYASGGGKSYQRKYFSQLDVDAPTSQNMVSFIEHSAKHPFAAKHNWGDHVGGFFENRSNFVLLRYEDLLADSEAALTSVMNSLSSEEVDPRRISESVDRYSFARQTGRDTGKENKGSYLRKGQSGDWKNHFSREAAQCFEKHFGQALVQAGYETDGSWVNEV